MISIITPVFSPTRVKKLKILCDEIQSKAGINVQHVIVVDGETETYRLMEGYGDPLLFLPRQVEWTHALNIGEKFARYPYIVALDDDITVETDDVFKKALDIFTARFPDGEGVLGFHDGERNSPRWMTTRKYAYQENLGNFIWPEYFHSGDDEVSRKAMLKNQYAWSPELRLVETKAKDEAHQKSLRCYEHDDWLLSHREAQGFPNHFQTVEPPTNDYLEMIKNHLYNHVAS